MGLLPKLKKIGNLRLTNNVLLKDVLVVPEYCVNLMSVHKLAKDNKLIVSFDENKCYVQDLKAMINLGTGSVRGGLYLFDEQETGKPIEKCNNATVCYVSINTWHNRLGHPSNQVLNVLKESLNINGELNTNPCKVCHKAKQPRDPFPLSDHKTSNLGDLIHLDVWALIKSQVGKALDTSLLLLMTFLELFRYFY